MSIVELLSNNGCFDFIIEWIRTRNSKRLLWTITFATFVLSANLDNLTTTTMMLLIMHNILQNSRQRMYVGSAIVIAANCGGCFTVIGDPTGLILWGDSAITASHFSGYLGIPALLAWIVPTILINRELPDRLDTAWSPSPYRGDDTRLNRWQRVVMLIVGIGGLWFIPTFHNITKLAPFLGEAGFLPKDFFTIHELLSRLSLDMWRAHPWLGAGLGSFADGVRFIATPEDLAAIPAQQSAPFGLHWLVLAERGSIGAFLILAPLAVLAASYVRRAVSGVAAGFPPPSCFAGLLVLPVAALESLAGVSLLAPDAITAIKLNFSVATITVAKVKSNG